MADPQSATGEYGLEADACPHCGGTTRLEEHGTLRWVCAACGGPRVPAPKLAGAPPVARSGNEARPLRDARKALLGAARARGLAWVLFVFAASLASAGALALTTTVGLAVVLFALGVISTVGALSQRANVKRRTNEATARIDEAWGRVAEDVLQASNHAHHDLTAAELAKAMRVDEGVAETLLSSLAVNDRARIDIGADAELRYAPTDVAAPSDALAEEAPEASDDANAARGAR